MKLFRLLIILTTVILASPVSTQLFSAQRSSQRSQQNHKSKGKGWPSWLPSWCKRNKKHTLANIDYDSLNVVQQFLSDNNGVNSLGLINKELNKATDRNKKFEFIPSIANTVKKVEMIDFSVEKLSDFNVLCFLIDNQKRLYKQNKAKQIRSLIINMDSIIEHEIRSRICNDFKWSNKTIFNKRLQSNEYGETVFSIISDCVRKIEVFLKESVPLTGMNDIKEFRIISDWIVKFSRYIIYDGVPILSAFKLAAYAGLFPDDLGLTGKIISRLLSNSKKIQLSIFGFDKMNKILSFLTQSNTKLQDLKLDIFATMVGSNFILSYLYHTKMLEITDNTVTKLNLNIESETAKKAVDLVLAITRLFPNLTELTYTLGSIDIPDYLYDKWGYYKDGSVMISKLLNLYKREEKDLITEIWTNHPHIKKINFRLNPIYAPFLGQPADFLDHVNEFLIETAPKRIAQFNNNFSLIKWDASDFYTVVRGRTNDTLDAESSAAVPGLDDDNEEDIKMDS